jgi:MFS family permease
MSSPASLWRSFRTRQDYPRQFWLLFWGMLISTTGASMIWPFLIIYISERLDQPLTVVASLITINSAFGLVFAFIAGPITDRLGRKWSMVVSLMVNGLAYLGLSQASSLGVFAVLYAISGAFNPLYRVGADAMMADLIPPEKRPDAYSMMRISNNIGVALGPAFGGFIAYRSYTLAFFMAAGGMIIYSLLIAFLAKETLPKEAESGESLVESLLKALLGYRYVLRDRQYLSFIFAFTLNQMCAAIMWLLLGVHAKQNFGVVESRYGLIPMTNALMVILFQIPVTRQTKRFPPLRTLSFGALFYALGVGSVALAGGFWGFWLSMVIMTIGELIMTPTATTLVANLAPADMRGRYMSLYGLTWGVAAGIGPVVGGMLNDQLGPFAIWYGGAIIGMTSTLAFLFLSHRSGERTAILKSN